MQLTTVLAALLLPFAALAQDTTEGTSTTTMTTTMTRTITIDRVAVTDTAAGTSTTDAAPEATGSSDDQQGAASGLAPMAFAGVAGMVVVALL